MMITWQQIYLMSVCGQIGRVLVIISLISLIFWTIIFIVSQKEELRVKDRTIFKFFIASLLMMILGMAIPNEQEVTAMVIVPSAVKGKDKPDVSFYTLDELQKQTNLWFDHVRVFYLKSKSNKKEDKNAR